MRRRQEIQKEHISKQVLLDVLKAGAVLAIAFTAPNALRFLSAKGKRSPELNSFYPSSISKQAYRLWRKGLIDIKETLEGYTVVVTEKGVSETLKFDMEALSVPRPEVWDGKWRMVFFDIPVGDNKIRNVFREHLQSMKFFQMQKSIYIHPYPCYKQIKFLREILGIPHNVKLATVDHLENDEDLRRIFRLEYNE